MSDAWPNAFRSRHGHQHGTAFDPQVSEQLGSSTERGAAAASVWADPMRHQWTTGKTCGHHAEDWLKFTEASRRSFL